MNNRNHGGVIGKAIILIALVVAIMIWLGSRSSKRIDQATTVAESHPTASRTVPTRSIPAAVPQTPPLAPMRPIIEIQQSIDRAIANESAARADIATKISKDAKFVALFKQMNDATATHSTRAADDAKKSIDAMTRDAADKDPAVMAAMRDLDLAKRELAQAQSRQREIEEASAAHAANQAAAAEAADPKIKLRRDAKTFTAAQIVGEYKDNEVRADEEMKNRWCKVSGRIDAIAKDILDHPYLTIAASEEGFRQVQCTFPDSAAKELATLGHGQSITVFGKCGGLMMNVQMSDCELVR